MKFSIYLSILLVSSIGNDLLAQYSTTEEVLLQRTRELDYLEFFDIDNDGDDDLIGLSFEGVHWLENDGLGNFNSDVIILKTFNANAFLIEDLNQDGFIDIITQRQGFGGPSGFLEIWGGDGSMSFTLENSLVINNSTGYSINKAIQTADINNDGFQDIINAGVSPLRVFIHNGDFNYIQQNTITMMDGVVLGDINGDGWIDIIGGQWENFRVAMNNGAGNFLPLSGIYDPGNVVNTNHSDFELVDIDGDGDLDLLHLIDADRKVFRWMNDGNGIFTNSGSIISNSTQIRNLVARDFNDDGIMDFAFKSVAVGSSNYFGQGNVKCMLGNGTSFDPVQTLSTLILGRAPMTFSSNIGNGADNLALFGEFQEQRTRVILATKSAPALYNDFSDHRVRYSDFFWGMLPFDVNNDGFVDFARPPLFHMNQGNGEFVTHVDSTFCIPPPSNSTYYKAHGHGDLNADGIQDIVGVRTDVNNDRVGYWLGQPGGTFASFFTEEIEPVSGAVKYVGVHDVNNDGLLDIYYLMSNGRIHHIISTGGMNFNNEFAFMYTWCYNNLTNNPFASYCFGGNAANPDDIYVAFQQNWYSQNSPVYVRTNGNPTPQNTGVLARFISVADIDNDGLFDIGYYKMVGGVGWIKNHGGGVFVDQGILYPLQYTTRPLFEDLDQDGDVDILLDDNNDILWLENSAYGTFALPQVLSENNNSSIGQDHFYFYYANDIDNDGDKDVLFQSDYGCPTDQTVGDFFKITNYQSGPYQISGTVFNDMSQNSMWDTGDVALTNLPVFVDYGAVDYSNQNGGFSFSPMMDTIMVSMNEPTHWSFTVGQTGYNIAVSNTDPIHDTIFFGLIPDSTVFDVQAELIGAFPRCNTIVNYWLGALNQGTELSSGVYELHLDDSISFISSSVPPDSIVGTTYYWHFDSLAPFDYAHQNITVSMPDFMSAGDTLQSILVEYVYDEFGSLNLSSSDTLSQILVCGYDPNDKIVEPIGIGEPGYVLNNQTMEYLVRFQNTGNDTVFNVKIVDHIHPNLDISTFQLLAYSHDLTYSIQPTGKLVFNFNDILLPDSSVNFLGSQGYLKFKIDMKDDLQPGEIIENRADIYFDFNPAILTNTTLNTIFECEQLNDLSLSGFQNNACEGEVIELGVSTEELWINTFEHNQNTIVSDTLSLVTVYPADTIHLVRQNLHCYFDTTLIIHVDEAVFPDLLLPDTQMICDSVPLSLESNYASNNAWYYNGTFVSSMNNIIASVSGNYLLINTNGACTASDSVYLNFASFAEIIMLDTITECIEGSKTLISTLPGNNIWYREGNLISFLNSINATTSGLYVLSNSDSPCPDPDSIYLNFAQSVDLMLPDSVSECFGTVVSLESNQIANNTWYLNGVSLGSSQIITTTTSGNYVLENNNGNCTVYDSVYLSFNPVPVVSYDIIGLNEVQANGDYDSYSWLNCENNMQVIQNENSQSFVAPSSGYYALSITNEYFCTDTSDCFLLAYLGVNDLSDSVLIFPNPVDQFLNVQFGKPVNFSYKIYSSKGDFLESDKVEGKDSLLIDVQRLSSGVYLLEINSEDERYNFRFVKE